MLNTDELEDQFYSHVRTAADDDCHRWTSARDPDGYGLFSFKGKDWKAHRIAAALDGTTIEDKAVFHICGNPGCVNPDHLYAEPLADDAKIGESPMRGENHRAPKGEAHGRSKLTRKQVLNMREDRARGDTLARLSEKYGVSEPQVRAITTGEQWDHIGGPRTRLQGLSKEDVAEIRRRYWWMGELQKDLAEAFSIKPSYVSMLVRGKSRPDAPGPISQGRPPIPPPEVQRQIRFAILEGEASVSTITQAYDLPREVVVTVIRSGGESSSDSSYEEIPSSE